jgi:hypothetical protein
MGLEDAVYERGTVHSQKDLRDITLENRVWEMLIQEQIHAMRSPDLVFRNCSDEEIKSVIEYIDDELDDEAPFGHTQSSIEDKALSYRKELTRMLME